MKKLAFGKLKQPDSLPLRRFLQEDLNIRGLELRSQSQILKSSILQKFNQ
ncbi:MAG: hypothetical protein K9J37_01480 [Saprospiraceae bacterium]|nr:hypothetical protein [Saprospiraceae bacterium]MCF8248547.1 hypothetical protein [Saprospiraceae bacterium]MCF8280286.1 hypothetical protein [Bacteroidales bacterium]MCF8310281.1 hypothetical protein [Saprospiraceae bacterium]MCF8439280.1 hypothetical protein [Saprospiraceae bacterium]